MQTIEPFSHEQLSEQPLVVFPQPQLVPVELQGNDSTMYVGSAVPF